ncbi:hypothetical protein Tco_0441399 [Tanacetum coccineum]
MEYSFVTLLVLMTIKRLYYCSIKSELKDGIKELKTDKDVEDFLRVGYENKCNHGSFNGLIDEPQPVDQEPIDDPNAASIDPLFKVKRGVSCPKHDPTIPWNEMQHVLEEDKRIQQKREYQEKLDEEAFQEAMELQHINEQMDKERERQNREEREWEERKDYFNAFTQESVTNDPSHPTQSTEVQVGDGQVTASAASNADVAANAQDKNKGKAIQERSNSKSSAKPVRKSKRLRQEEPQPFRIYVKNRGRSERTAKLQGKNFKFDAQGTGSTPDKAFDVSESE